MNIRSAIDELIDGLLDLQEQLIKEDDVDDIPDALEKLIDVILPCIG
jgi:hypothetical protein